MSTPLIIQSEPLLDILQPYLHRYDQPSHGLSRRSSSTSCSLVNETTDKENHIFVSPNNNYSGASIDIKVFEWKVPNRFYRPLIRGHAVRIPRPGSQVSVRHAGCREHRRETVSHQVNSKSFLPKDGSNEKSFASSELPHCSVATNAGFFNTRDSTCYGNLVSHGERVLNFSSYRNAHFGVLEDGHLFFGYLTEDMFHSLAFRHLVGGVIWLLKNGTQYIEESLKLECESVEETGTLKYFSDVISARTALGSDIHGNVWMIHVDGRTSESGINLWEMAQLLRDRFQMMNAINLDGGGSSTMVWHDTLINYPSDRCSEPYLLCERPVTSIICASETIPPQEAPYFSSISGICVLLVLTCVSSLFMSIFLLVWLKRKSVSLVPNCHLQSKDVLLSTRFPLTTSSRELALEDGENGALLKSDEDDMCPTHDLTLMISINKDTEIF